MAARFYLHLTAILAVSLMPISAVATEPAQLHAHYIAICAEIAQVQESDAYGAATYTGRRAMEQRVIQSAYDVPEVRQTFEAIAQADPERKYQLLRESVEIQTDRSWECEALERVR